MKIQGEKDLLSPESMWQEYEVKIQGEKEDRQRVISFQLLAFLVRWTNKEMKEKVKKNVKFIGQHNHNRNNCPSIF